MEKHKIYYILRTDHLKFGLRATRSQRGGNLTWEQVSFVRKLNPAGERGPVLGVTPEPLDEAHDQEDRQQRQQDHAVERGAALADVVAHMNQLPR